MLVCPALSVKASSEFSFAVEFCFVPFRFSCLFSSSSLLSIFFSSCATYSHIVFHPIVFEHRLAFLRYHLHMQPCYDIVST